MQLVPRNSRENQTDLAQAIARWENEGGATAPIASKAAGWFVPPLMIPALLVAFVVARFVQLTYYR